MSINSKLDQRAEATECATDMLMEMIPDLEGAVICLVLNNEGPDVWPYGKTERVYNLGGSFCDLVEKNVFRSDCGHIDELRLFKFGIELNRKHLQDKPKPTDAEAIGNA